MAYLTVGKENDADIQLYYEDRGSGRPVLLIHGWPLDGGSWERQARMLLQAGYRVVTYDRRGFGRSSAPSVGYDYNTLASDTAVVIEKLKLDDAALVGFSMGGGEVARYAGQNGKGVSQVAFISAITPALRKDGNNPDGVDPSVFEGIKRGIEADRYAFLDEFLHNFFNKKLVGGQSMSKEALAAFTAVGAGSSYGAMLDCVDAWLEDFRPDLAQITVPALVIHGDADQIIPLEVSGKRVSQYLKQAQLHVVKNGPHGLTWTHATECNTLLLQFLRSHR